MGQLLYFLGSLKPAAGSTFCPLSMRRSLADTFTIDPECDHLRQKTGQVRQIKRLDDDPSLRFRILKPLVKCQFTDSSAVQSSYEY